MQETTQTRSAPSTRLLGNGTLQTLIHPSGSGHSSHDWVALTRSSNDALEDHLGYYVYLRDLDTDAVWSVTPKPTLAPIELLPVAPRPGLFRVKSCLHGLEAEMDVAVSADHPLEIRRIRLTDTTGKPRRIEVTSYVEIVLNHPMADEAHPAFSKLFVQTEADEKLGVLLAHRRPRSSGETGLWIMHSAHGGEDGQYETDRAEFIGRGHSLARPAALAPGKRLANTLGNVLDPVFASRRTVNLEAGQTGEIAYTLGVATEREEAIKLRLQASTAKKIETQFDKADKRERACLKELDMTQDQADHYQ